MQTSKENQVDQLLETHRLNIDELELPDLSFVWDHWNQVRGSGFAPTLRNFRLESLPVHIIPRMVIVDFLGPPLDYFYRFFGSEMVRQSGLELTGKRYFADGVKGFGFVNAEWFPVMIKQRYPLLTETHWRTIHGVGRVTTTLRLPISNDGESIDHGVTVNHFQNIDG
ncbi:MAG: hypothetical protein HQ483_06310 [Rhodospirillales bacterium]|nr:hypothetical protein [Rhodospirillales bacterium]